MADCVCDTNGLREFPDNLYDVLIDGFGTTIPRKLKGLGGKSLLTNKPEATITILVKNELDTSILLEWWTTELNCGINNFSINVPFFGIRRDWNVRVVGDLTESLKLGTTREVKMKLEILDDLQTAINENEYIGA